MQRHDLRDWVRFTVRWSDMDAYRHVNNARYFTYFEMGRIHIFEQIIAGNWQDAPAGPVLASVTCNFREPVVYPATLEIGTAMTRLGNKSFDLTHQIYFADSEQTVADGKSVIVWIDRATGKPTAVDDALRDKLNRFAAALH